MPLDHDPIYCAEQIVIPPDLGDILKAYAKEVIRNEPEDIYEFSAKYFAQFVTSEARISTDQLIMLRQKFAAEYPAGSVGQADLYTIATSTEGDSPGIPPSAVDKVLQLGDFNQEAIDWKEFVVLLLSLEGEDVLQSVQLLFEVFSDEGDCTLAQEEFMELFRPFAARDRLLKSIQDFEDRLTTCLRDEAASKNGRISFDDFMAAPVLADLGN